MGFKKLLKKAKDLIGTDGEKAEKVCIALEKGVEELEVRKEEIKSELKEDIKKSKRKDLIEELEIIEKQVEKAKKRIKKLKTTNIE
jgi:predicted phage-related endonuclease